MLEVDDILPSPLTPLVLAPRVPKPVCEMQTPALFTMVQTSPQPQSVDTANYARVNPLPSPATSSSSSDKLHLYIDSDTSSPTVPAGLQSSSQELQGTSQVPHPPPLISTAHTAVSTTQPPIQPTHIPSWVDEVATAEQSGHEMVVYNWANSVRIRGARPRSQPLVYLPPVMLTPRTQRPSVTSPRYGPALPPLRPQQSFPHPPPHTTDLRQLTITLALTPHLGGLHGQQHMRSTRFALRRYKLHNRLLATQQTLPEAHSPHPLAEGQTLSRQHTAFPTVHKDLISHSTSSQTLSALIPSRVYTCQRELATPPLRLSTR